MTLHYFLTNWAENSIYARFYSIKMSCLRYLAEKKKSPTVRLTEMLYLDIVSKIIMQLEDIAHLCLFVSDIPRHTNAFYFSTNEEVRQFFEDDKFISPFYIKKYLGIDYKIDSLRLKAVDKEKLEDILQSSIELCKNLLIDSKTLWKDYNLIAKHYLHGIPNFSLKEARDIEPIDLRVIPEEAMVAERPQDFMTLVMINESSGEPLFRTIQHTSTQVKSLLKISAVIHNLTKAVAGNELSKLDFSMSGMQYLYFFDKEEKSAADIAFVKKYFIIPWLN
jgi:hypothetical protein